MDCILERVGESPRGNRYRCAVCKEHLDSALDNPLMIHRVCRVVAVVDRIADSESPLPPSMMHMAWSATVAHAKWAKAGMPTRSAEDIAKVFAICRTCIYFAEASPTRGHCKICGCGLAAAGGLGNKISMATEHCPLTPAKW